jgi:4'-phosphopantetheinyl transferase
MWLPPSENLTLGHQDVHVWQASLALAPASVQYLEQVLAADERERAARFHFQRDRVRFVAAHGLLRVILGRYLGDEPGRLTFSLGSHGKPALSAPANAPHPLRFNLSHSHDVALYAVARSREVGVDVERIRMDQDLMQLAARFFSPGEVAALRALPESILPEAFFNCWARKEAYIKAVGEGLGLDLRAFEVSLRPGEPAALLVTRHDPREASRWALHHLTPAPGYAAALAVEGQDYRLSLWQYPEG